jgi:hypothetical protein
MHCIDGRLPFITKRFYIREIQLNCTDFWTTLDREGTFVEMEATAWRNRFPARKADDSMTINHEFDSNVIDERIHTMKNILNQEF